MHSNRWRNAVLTAFLATLLAAAGCTGTEVLVSGQETLNVEIQLVNADTRFESAFFNLVQISLRPLDPDANEALEADGLGTLHGALSISYSGTGSVASTVSVGEGVYQVTSVILGAIQYRDLDPPTSTATCQEYVSLWNLFNPNPSSFLITDFGEEVFLTVESGATNQLTLVIDGGALEEAFLNSWSCRQTFLCVPNVPWCLYRISAATFTAQAPDFLAFQ